ncbi:MAG TPA: cobalamin-dependent protein [Syntrophorhabdaceae bacterium]|nr:cobalamin-dependent protein [Syntrophorhabdaceae bacterium]HNT69507.1 cobalamin-dependent protein [Syntrophorhabdaceae bacterium]
MSVKKRIIMAKMGLDAHDNGLRIVSKWCADAGYEVIYAGVYNSAERILQMTIEEDADAVGLSFLGGEHIHYSKKLLELFKAHGLENVKLFTGGIIPPADVAILKNMGVDAVFTPGSRRDEILSGINSCFEKRGKGS